MTSNGPRLLPNLRLLVFALFAFGAAFRGAAAPAAADRVTAALVAHDQSIQPGHPFLVALRLEHAPHWHTYWLNPGTGLATTIRWTLPAGFTAGEIEWPAPTILRDHSGAIVGNGYDGETFLLVTITPPASLPAGEKITMRAAVDWLVCSDVCVPGNAKLSLELPVGEAPPAADPSWAAKLDATRAGLPRTLPDWQATASHAGGTVTLRLAPAGNHATHTPAQLHFFSSDGFIAFDQPQTVGADSNGGFVLTLPVSADATSPAPTRLRGVVTSENGWLPDGSLRGLAVDAEFNASEHATASAASTVSPSTGAPAVRGLGATLLLAFVGGLILNLMPCVFPVLGIKIIGFVNQAGHDRGKVVGHGLVFALGVLLSFWALAAALALLRAGGEQLGWGFQLQSPAFVFALAILLLVFALNMSGVFEFGLRATSVGGELQTKTGLTGSFFTGVLATVVATPCSAPFLAPALGAALALSTAQSFAIFTAIAIGLAMPYLLLSLFPSAVRVLPRPGAWMETFKQFMAFPLYGTVGYLIWVLAGQVGDEGLQNVLFGLVLVALGVWCYGRWTAPGASAARVRFGVVALLVAGGAGAWLGWPRSSHATAGAPEIVWTPWSPEAVAELRAQNRIVYVDFTARWCATCQANKKLVFHSDDVLREFARRKIATLRADWTNQDPRITAELARYHRSAVPFNVIWFPGKADPVILPELLTPSIVLDALERK